MICSECNTNIADNAICCDCCKSDIRERLNIIIENLQFNDYQYIFGAYGVMNNWNLLNNVVSVYGKDRLILCGGRTVEQQRKFISNAYDEYIQNPKDWSTIDLDYYKKQMEHLIAYILGIL